MQEKNNYFVGVGTAVFLSRRLNPTSKKNEKIFAGKQYFP